MLSVGLFHSLLLDFFYSTLLCIWKSFSPILSILVREILYSLSIPSLHIDSSKLEKLLTQNLLGFLSSIYHSSQHRKILIPVCYQTWNLSHLPVLVKLRWMHLTSVRIPECLNGSLSVISSVFRSRQLRFFLFLFFPYLITQDQCFISKCSWSAWVLYSFFFAVLDHQGEYSDNEWI